MLSIVSLGHLGSDGYSSDRASTADSCEDYAIKKTQNLEALRIGSMHELLYFHPCGRGLRQAIFDGTCTSTPVEEAYVKQSSMELLGTIVAPKTFAASYIKCLWNGGSVATLVWFLQRWKRNVLTRFLRTKSMSSSEKERYLALDQMSSFILLFIGALGIAEALGMAVQSLLTAGGIGGIATAIAARDVLGNFLSGLALIFAKPFSVGDLIQAGHVEGRVEEVGIHSTRLLNTEKNPISVPNSHFSSQVIVNRSRAPYRALVVKIPVHLKDFEKMTVATGEIRSMLKNHPEVYVGEDKPRCSISRFSAMAMEIFISCNIKQQMSNEDYYETEQDIMIQSARIITQSGAVLGGLL